MSLSKSVEAKTVGATMLHTKNLQLLRNHLHNFDENLSFEALTEFRLMDYINYLRTTLDMRNSTIEKKIRYLKWFLRWNTKERHNTNRDFEDFKPKLKSTKKKVIFLTWKELNQLRDCVIPETEKYLERLRNVFLFFASPGSGIRIYTTCGKAT